MKHTRVSLLALSALAGGVFIASAADVGTNYNLNAYFTNDPPVQLVDVSGLPTLAGTTVDSDGYGVVATDGSGKIEGVMDLEISELTGGTYSKGVFIVDIKGNVKTSGKPAIPSVQMQVKGSGYLEDATGTSQAEGTIDYKFTSTSGIQTVSSTVGSIIDNQAILNDGRIPLVYLNEDGTTNYTTYFYPSRYEYFYPGSTNVQLNYRYSYVETNPAVGDTNIYQYSEAYDDDTEFDFGTPIGAAVNTNYTIGTNVFSTYVIGYYRVYYPWSYGTNWSTNNTIGFALSDMDAIVSAYITANSGSSTGANWSDYWTYLPVTDPYPDLGQTNIDDSLTLSNGWAEIPGSLSGSIKASGYSKMFDGGTARLWDSHYVYTLVSNTNEDYITATWFNNNALDIWNMDSLYAKVVTFGKKMWLSSDEPAFSGKGTLDPKKSTFKASLKGVAWSKGSSLKIDGITTNVIVGLDPLTNIVTIENIAALALPAPPVTTVMTNEANWGYQWVSQYVNVTNTVGVNNVESESYWDIQVPSLLLTNSVPNAISKINASGKMMGQTVSPISGFNPDYD